MRAEQFRWLPDAAADDEPDRLGIGDRLKMGQGCSRRASAYCSIYEPRLSCKPHRIALW